VFLKDIAVSAPVAELIVLDRHVIGFARRDHPGERCAKPVRSPFRGRLAGEHLEYRPAGDRFVGVRRAQILLARGLDGEIRIGTQDQEQTRQLPRDPLDVHTRRPPGYRRARISPAK
jgi:hypothetical protein